MTWEQCRLIDHSMRRCAEIASTKFLLVEPPWQAEAAFALLLINLRDGLVTASGLGQRVAFSDDLPLGDDVTHAVVRMRNAICHNGSPSRQIDANGNTISFGQIRGAGTLLATSTFTLSNPYDDDVALFYGRERLLLRRHIHRAIDEIWTALQTLAPQFDYHLPGD